MSEMERFVKNIARKLANRLSYQIGMFRRGSKSVKGDTYPLADLDREGGEGSKSAVKLD